MPIRGRRIRAVVDTNVLLRSLVSQKGPSATLIDLARKGRYQLVTSPTLMRELRATLFARHFRKRFPVPVEEIAEFLVEIRELVDLIQGRLAVHSASRDPKDNPVLACAIEGRAQYVVTDDRRDLLPLKHYHGVQIVAPVPFVRLITAQ